MPAVLAFTLFFSKAVSMKFSLRKWLAAALLGTLLGHAQAVPILDQDNVSPTGNANGQVEWQQEVKSGMAGLLAGIQLYALRAQTLTVRIATGSAFTTGPFQFSQVIALNGANDNNYDLLHPSSTYIDTSAAGIMLAVGDIFVIDLLGSNMGCCSLSRNQGSYAGGDLYYKFGGGPTLTDFSLPFQTFIEARTVSKVPEPASLVLVFGALAALVTVRRRRLG